MDTRNFPVSIEVGEMCFHTFPCQHHVTLHFADGKSISCSLLTGRQIYQLFEEFEEAEDLNNMKNHFDQYQGLGDVGVPPELRLWIERPSFLITRIQDECAKNEIVDSQRCSHIVQLKKPENVTQKKVIHVFCQDALLSFLLELGTLSPNVTVPPCSSSSSKTHFSLSSYSFMLHRFLFDEEYTEYEKGRIADGYNETSSC